MTRIRQLRDSRGLTQKALAIDLKVSQATISAWENGTKAMSNRSASKFADYFGVSIDYLLGRKDATTEREKPTVNDDGLRAKAIDRIQALPDPALERVLDFLEGIEVGRGIASGEAAAGGPADKSTQ